MADTGWRTENINLLFTFIKFSEASSEAFALITFCPLQAFPIRVAFEADSLKHYQNNLEHKSRNRIAFTHFEKNKDHNHVSALSVLRAHPLLSPDCPPPLTVLSWTRPVPGEEDSGPSIKLLFTGTRDLNVSDDLTNSLSKTLDKIG